MGAIVIAEGRRGRGGKRIVKVQRQMENRKTTHKAGRFTRKLKSKFFLSRWGTRLEKKREEKKPVRSIGYVGGEKTGKVSTGGQGRKTWRSKKGSGKTPENGSRLHLKTQGGRGVHSNQGSDLFCVGKKIETTPPD